MAPRVCSWAIAGTPMLGFNCTEYHRDGEQADGPPTDQTEREISPYAGLIFDVTSNAMLYASYSDIYQPQDQYDINLEYLDPSKGVNYEVGAKASWLDDRLVTSIAFFKAEQENLATLGGVTEDLQYWYTGIDVESEGVELEVSGRLTDYLGINAGFTSLSLDGVEDEGDVYPWVPRRTANLWLTSTLPSFTALELGLGASLAKRGVQRGHVVGRRGAPGQLRRAQCVRHMERQ